MHSENVWVFWVTYQWEELVKVCLARLWISWRQMGKIFNSSFTVIPPWNIAVIQECVHTCDKIKLSQRFFWFKKKNIVGIKIHWCPRMLQITPDTKYSCSWDSWFSNQLSTSCMLLGDLLLRSCLQEKLWPCISSETNAGSQSCQTLSFWSGQYCRINYPILFLISVFVMSTSVSASRT